MINRFRKYLEILDVRLSHLFEKQAPFIKCKKGCAYCCKDGEYPLSELEYANLMIFYHTLPSEIQGTINQKIEKLLKSQKQKFYECPFLIKDSCSVYEARPLICRAFGLISFKENGRNKIPFCMDLGLNYANAYDSKTGLLTKYADDGTEPCAYNIDRKTLRNKEMEDMFDIYFGEDKTLVEWLSEDNYFFEEK